MATSSGILQEVLGIPLQSATHKTILWWVKKLGYYTLTKPKPVANDWIILLDHTIQLDPSKLFVIWGIRASTIDFTRPLRYQDLEPLWISTSTQWTGDFIAELLERLQATLGQITYAVGDYGSDIRKGLRVAGIPHVHDVTHRIALILKRLYADDPSYQAVSQRLAQIRRQLGQSVASHLQPPKQRTKSRYHNLRPIAEYGQYMLTYLASPPTSDPADAAFREKMSWIADYRGFFEELSEVTACVCEVERHLKQYGLSALTTERCSHLLTPVFTPKGRCFTFDVLVYLHTTLGLTTVKDALLCTSDILESAFGKYKNYVSRNPMAGVTDLALCLAAFTCSLSSQEISEALEHTTVHDVTHWVEIYLGSTLLKKRRDFFQLLDSQKSRE